MQTHKELIDALVASGVLHTPRIIGAFRAIDRARSMREETTDEAYGDYPLPIGFGATISQPTTVAFMLELLEPKSGQKILDVGSGSGWTTALLGAIVGPTGRVIGVEIVPELVAFARANIQHYPSLSNVTIQQSGDALGLSAQAPFDRILVSASASSEPQELIDQLAPHGVLVLPIHNSIWRITNTAERLEREEYPGFVFVPLQSA